MEPELDPGVGNCGEESSDLLARAIAAQAEFLPPEPEAHWLDEEPVTEAEFPGVDLDLARVRRIGVSDLVENRSLRDVIDVGVIGSAVLAEAQGRRAPRVKPEPGSRSPRVGPSDDCRSWAVQFDPAGRAAFTAAARHLGIREGQSLSLVPNGDLMGWSLVGLVADDSGYPAAMSSKGRLQVAGVTADWLRSLWGGSEIPPLTVSGPGHSVLAVLCPSSVIGRILRDAC